MQTQRTTVRIKKPLYKKAKKKAVEMDISLQELINQSLIRYLTNASRHKMTDHISFNDKMMGLKKKRPLTRKDLY